MTGRVLVIAVGLSMVSGRALVAEKAAGETTLSGSRSSMTYQNRVAKENDFSFLRTSAQVKKMVLEGRLVWVPGNADYTLSDVSHPYARPVLKTFVERLAERYRAACGQRMVVTSLTRPTNEQPRNASPLSVHPAGMAVDLRIPASPTCRIWLESALLTMEQKELLDVTREKNPPHYHVAVFPEEYGAYADVQLAQEAAEREAQLASIVMLPPVEISLAPPESPRAMSSGPGMLASLLFAVSALAGGMAVLMRMHERAVANAATAATAAQSRSQGRRQGDRR